MQRAGLRVEIVAAETLEESLLAIDAVAALCGDAEAGKRLSACIRERLKAISRESAKERPVPTLFCQTEPIIAAADTLPAQLWARGPQVRNRPARPGRIAAAERYCRRAWTSPGESLPKVRRTRSPPWHIAWWCSPMARAAPGPRVAEAAAARAHLAPQAGDEGHAEVNEPRGACSTGARGRCGGGSHHATCVGPSGLACARVFVPGRQRRRVEPRHPVRCTSRVLLAGCVGAALSAAVAHQAVLRNPLADPYIWRPGGLRSAPSCSSPWPGATLGAATGRLLTAFVGARHAGGALRPGPLQGRTRRRRCSSESSEHPSTPRSVLRQRRRRSSRNVVVSDGNHGSPAWEPQRSRDCAPSAWPSRVAGPRLTSWRWAMKRPASSGWVSSVPRGRS